MKITELKCTSCNGTLKISEENPHIAVCEYCNTRYVIEKDGNQNVHLSMENQKNQNASRGSVILEGETGGNGKRIAIFAACALFFIITFGLRGALYQYQNNKAEKEAAAMAGRNSLTVESSTEESGVPLTGALASMAETAFGRPATELSEEELSRFKWLELKYESDELQLGYSFENPYEDAHAELVWLSFPRDGSGNEYEQLSRFTGLKKLNVAGYLPVESLKGLSLEGLSCFANSPSDIAELSVDAAGLKEINFVAGLEDLSGLNGFQNLESLTLEGSNLSDIKDLVNMKSLKSLNLMNCDDVTDFTVLSVMPWLEELSVESEAVRDIGFLSNLPNLKAFSLTDAQVLEVNDLAATGLTSLTIDDCDEIKDLSGIAGLSGLTGLSLDIPYNCPQPDLSGLTGLTSLSISGAKDMGFLQNMKSLESLLLEGCKINNNDVFSGLTGLKRLSCFRLSGDFPGLSFINSIPSLEYLNVNGMSTYEDISGLFGIPALQELYLNGVECEINFAKIKPNESLKILEMDGMKLYTNVQISGSGGIYYVDYDKVSLDENTGFLTNFPGLKKLSLADNTLTGIAFASSLPLLESLNISENYVTDLKPLANLTELKTVTCTNNPIENYRVLNDKVTAIH
ncbi:leucine-rich repeat domain-containing protein [Clostridium sp. Marseille-P2415]|uniref:leucine-rich repeat domain-containing protein n=1 Tax=Clostridium sp. Marseille-P2415 TaxID=1805471 RepID=UPI00098861B4|nr:leucine-rich repeat domain-containing protein [Clostridium sp. Marseille-P2415]